MKIVNILFSIFFAIAIGFHIKEVIDTNGKELLWHSYYFVTYGICWAMIFSKSKWNYLIFGLSAIFPLVTHIYYGYQHFPFFDKMFWICVVVCFTLIFGVYWLWKKPINKNKILERRDSMH